MDAETELKLYDHVEFLDPSNGANESKVGNVVRTKTTANSKKKKKNKNKNQQKKQQANKLQAISKPKRGPFEKGDAHTLSAQELLFFPTHQDVTPLYSKADPNDLPRKYNYLDKIRTMSSEEQRDHRAKRDIRYLHKNANNSNATAKNVPEEKQFCLDHLSGRCKSQQLCGRWHQMRKTLFFGVCKFYISGACTKGDQCAFMHEDFPCRYYYLDIEHPKSIDVNNCRFMHGGPLPQRLYRYFMKQIEMWVEELTKENPERFDNKLMEFTDKFEAKQDQLEEEFGVEHNKSSTTAHSNDDGFSLESVLTIKQMDALAMMNVKTAAQINKLPIDDLLDLGISMDQIYKITANTYIQTNTSHESHATDNTLADEESNSGGATKGEEILLARRRLFEINNGITECMAMQIDSVVEAKNESHTDTELPNSSSGSSSSSVLSQEDEEEEEDDVDNSEDSDNENSLIINEDFI